MSYKTYTDEQKQAIIEVVCDELRHTSAPISEFCKRHGVSYRTLLNWAKENESYSNMLNDAQTQMALRYLEEAKKLIDSAITYYVDGRGQIHESSVALNKVRLQVELRCKIAGIFAQDLFGDYRYQIKEIINRIRQIEKGLDEQNNTACKTKRYN